MCSRKLFLVLLFLLPQPILAGQEADPEESEYQGRLDRSQVFVVVERHDGWGHVHRAGLAGDGRFTLVGAYFDTTAIRCKISPDSALTFINDLLAIDFLGQPEVYRATRGEAVPTEDGRLSLVSTRAFDAGSSRITLHLGSRMHSVLLEWPAYGAPEALVDWERRFHALMKQHFDWLEF
jgi:hypothetical protein